MRPVTGSKPWESVLNNIVAFPKENKILFWVTKCNVSDIRIIIDLHIKKQTT